MEAQSNQEKTMLEIESAFEDSKAERLKARHVLEAARGRWHMELVARREAGENWTMADMRAMEAKAIDDVPYVKDAYLNFIKADSQYRHCKVQWEAAKREYWDNKTR